METLGRGLVLALQALETLQTLSPTSLLPKPTPDTRSPKPLNPKPDTRNPKPETEVPVRGIRGESMALASERAPRAWQKRGLEKFGTSAP